MAPRRRGNEVEKLHLGRDEGSPSSRAYFRAGLYTRGGVIRRLRDRAGPLRGRGRQPAEEVSPLIAYPDAEKRIPPQWRTVERLLDIRLWKPKRPAKGKTRKARTATSNEEDVDEDPVIAKERALAYDEGEEPSTVVTLEEFEAQTGEKLNEKHAVQVAWAFIKWDDLGYDDG